MLDIASIRRQFPILSERFGEHPLVYLDAAATAQKPHTVLDAERDFTEHANANTHRGMHVLAERATERFEGARATVRHYLNAASPAETIFTHGTTESINLVARGWGSMLKKGDVIAFTRLEHHSNVVPWMQLATERGVEIAWIDIDDTGHMRLDQLRDLLASGRVRLVAMTALSNVLGVRTSVREVADLAHAAGALLLVDAAQSVAHGPTDVQAMDCDFLAFSGHKLYGPTGIGVLYGKRALLEKMHPVFGGGMMIGEVRDDGFTCADLPQKFEAGTQALSGAVGLGAAIEWVSSLGWEDLAAHEHTVLHAALSMLRSVEGVHILGPGSADNIAGCISVTVEGVHPHDLTEILGRQGFCLRAGHHCAQPLHRRLGIGSSMRLSVCAHTTVEEVESLADPLRDAIHRLRL